MTQHHGIRFSFTATAFCLAALSSPIQSGPTAISASDSVTPAQYLQSLEQPRFRPDHSLLPLSLAPGWGPAMPFDVRKELADNWGWGLFFGKVNQKSMQLATTDDQSVYYKVLDLARRDPENYPLDVLLNTQNYFRSGKHVVSPEKTPSAYLRDSTGAVSNVASPETPDSIWNLVIADLTVPLRQLKEEGVDFNVIQHWSEWFFHVWGWGNTHYKQDKRIMEAIAAIDTTHLHDHPHYDRHNLYLHTRRAWYERRLADTAKAIAPNRNSYNWYGLSGGTDYGRYGGYDNWTSFQYGVGGAEKINDYPGASLYRPDQGNFLNRGGTDNNVRDLLTSALSSKGVEIAHGLPLSQSWVWISQKHFDGFDRYIGYLKSLYVLGMVGFINFLMPEQENNYKYDIPFAQDSPPTWLQQVVAFSHVHALFSWLDDFIREGKLVEGPYRHVFWAQHTNWPGHEPYPGYVLDNPYEIMRNAGGGFGNPGEGKVRVVARRKPDGKLLVCAWAADDTTRVVPVKLPGGKEVSLEATPRGSLYWGDDGDLERIDEGRIASLVSLRHQAAGANGARQSSLDIERCRSSIRVSLSLRAESRVTLGVYTLQGRCLWTDSRRMRPGRGSLRVPTKELPHGTHVIRVRTGTRTSASSFVTLR